MTADQYFCQPIAGSGEGRRRKPGRGVGFALSPLPPPKLVHNEGGGGNLASLPWAMDDLVTALPASITLPVPGWQQLQTVL